MLGAGAGAVSWLCTWWRQVAGAGAGAGCRCCELAVHVVETGCWCWCRVLAVRVVEIGRHCWVLAPVHGPLLETRCRLVETAGAGAGAVVVETGRRSWALVLRMVEPGAGSRLLATPALGAGAGRRKLACRCLVLVPASDSEVIKSAGSDSEG